MIRPVLNTAALVLLTLLAAAVALPVVLVSRVWGVMVIARAWSRTVLAVCGVQVESHGFEQAAPGRAYLVMPNHTSYFDVIALYACVPFPVRFVAKKELALLPVFGWALALGAAIIIDRRNRERAIRSVRRAQRAIARGHSVVLFPEGTRTPAGQLGDLKKGPFHLATEAGVRVLPVGIEGSGAILESGRFWVRGGRVRIRVGTPIDASEFGADEQGRSALARRVRTALIELGAESPGRAP